MATRKIEVGPTGQRLAGNIKAIRTERGLKLDDLSGRLNDLGRPIPKSGLSKIESGERRVDVDDLVALAIALQVTPNRLLLSGGIRDEQIGLTENFSTSDRAAWQWSCADDVRQVISPLDPRAKELHDGFLDPAGYPFQVQGKPVPILNFKRENRPHRPPVLLSPAEWRQMKPFEDRIAEIRNDVNAAGLNWRAFVDDTVFEAHDDPEHEHKD